MLAMAIAFMTVLTANAQVRFGIKGGLDVTEMSFKGEVFDTDNRLGWFIGPTLRLGTPLTGISADISALYNQRETKIDLYYMDDSAESQQVDALKTKQVLVPLNVRLGFGLGEMANIFIFGGPQVAFRIGDESQSIADMKDDAMEWRLKSSNFSVNAGGGFTIGHLQLAANYSIGLGKTGDVTFKTATETIREDKATYKSWQVSATYYF